MSSSTETYPGPLHPERTDRNTYQYFFYVKHHNPHNKDASQWLPELSHDEEFQIFNQADVSEIVGANGDLFGLRRGPEEQILILGTDKQMIAEFPHTDPGRAWHGYPMWPIRKGKTAGRYRQPTPREALKKMKEAGWITENQRKRLEAGKDA
jgi:hypothetical protein